MAESSKITLMNASKEMIKESSQKLLYLLIFQLQYSSKYSDIIILLYEDKTFRNSLFLESQVSKYNKHLNEIDESSIELLVNTRIEYEILIQSLFSRNLWCGEHELISLIESLFSHNINTISTALSAKYDSIDILKYFRISEVLLYFYKCLIEEDSNQDYHVSTTTSDSYNSSMSQFCDNNESSSNFQSASNILTNKTQSSREMSWFHVWIQALVKLQLNHEFISFCVTTQCDLVVKRLVELWMSFIDVFASVIGKNCMLINCFQHSC